MVNFSYKGYYRYFITLRCFKQASYFRDDEVVAKALSVLQDTAKRRNFCVWAYCFMPDHVHLLIEGKRADADMANFVSVFKQRTAFWFGSLFKAKLWQPGYYDRVLRKDENTSAVVRYMFENPVRKRIVTDYLQYKNSGSLELTDIRQLFE